MVLHVRLFGRSTHSPLTRGDLLKKLRHGSPRSYHATCSYLWTEDSLFTRLRPVELDGVGCSSSSCCYYAFKADLSCGGNNDDVRVALMVLMDLTVMVDNLAVVVTEREEIGGEVVEMESEENNVVLIELADVLEKSEEGRNEYLKRWGAEEHNYHQTMVHRVMLLEGFVYALPLSLQSHAHAQESEWMLPLHLLSMNLEEREHYREDTITQALYFWSHEVERVMREESWHLAVVAVPVAVAELVDMHPQLVRAALLYHTVLHPLSWFGTETDMSASSTKYKDMVHSVIAEYRISVQNKHYVRLPLRMSRYTFAHFFCAGFPRALAETPLTTQLQARKAAPLSSAEESSNELEADERELLLGLQLTVALHRLRCEVTGSHTSVIEGFLKELRYGNEAMAPSSNGEGHNVFSQSSLERLRRKMMPDAFRRGDSIDWMSSYAQEAAKCYNMTENDLLHLDESMLLESDESDGTTSVEGDNDRSNSGSGSVPFHEDDNDDDVRQQLGEIESLMETRMCEAVLGGCDDEEATLRNVVDNALFLETIQMLTHDNLPRK